MIVSPKPGPRPGETIATVCKDPDCQQQLVVTADGRQAVCPMLNHPDSTIDLPRPTRILDSLRASAPAGSIRIDGVVHIDPAPRLTGFPPPAAGAAAIRMMRA